MHRLAEIRRMIINKKYKYPVQLSECSNDHSKANPFDDWAGCLYFRGLVKCLIWDM